MIVRLALLLAFSSLLVASAGVRAASIVYPPQDFGSWHLEAFFSNEEKYNTIHCVNIRWEENLKLESSDRLSFWRIRVSPSRVLPVEIILKSPQSAWSDPQPAFPDFGEEGTMFDRLVNDIRRLDEPKSVKKKLRREIKSTKTEFEEAIKVMHYRHVGPLWQEPCSDF